MIKEKLMKTGLRRPMITALLLLLMTALTSCSTKNWVEESGKKCKVFDSHPVETQSVEWEGPCKEGYAADYGVLKVSDSGEPAFICEGSMVEGRFHGLVKFAVVKDGKIREQYEEKWVMGVRKKRLKNLSLETSLAGAANAREYLHRLASYSKAAPDAWMTHFHRVLLEKISFACRDMEVNIPGIVGKGGTFIEDSDGKEGTQGVKRGKINKGELLLKTWNHINRRYVYHTVYNHPAHTVKSLKEDGNIPGGEQFHTFDPSALCTDKEVPDKLPATYRPVRIYGIGEEMGGELGEEGDTRWYPTENPKVDL